MALHTLTENVAFAPITIDGTNYLLTTGTSDGTSNIIDTFGYEVIVFGILVGAIASSGSVTTKLQHDTDSAGGTMADVAGSAHVACADTDDNKLILTEVWHPQKRYWQIVTTRGDGGNSTINGGFVLLARPGQAAVAQGTTVYAVKKLLSPVSGTA